MISMDIPRSQYNTVRVAEQKLRRLKFFISICASVKTLSNDDGITVDPRTRDTLEDHPSNLPYS